MQTSFDSKQFREVFNKKLHKLVPHEEKLILDELTKFAEGYIREILRGETSLKKFDYDLTEFFEDEPKTKNSIVKFCKDYIDDCKNLFLATKEKDNSQDRKDKKSGEVKKRGILERITKKNNDDKKFLEQFEKENEDKIIKKIKKNENSEQIIKCQNSQISDINFKIQDKQNSEQNSEYKKQFSKQNIKCKFLIKGDCKNDPCPYSHEQCQFFPTCKYGAKCNYIHPKCKFEPNCTNPNCQYEHILKGHKQQSSDQYNQFQMMQSMMTIGMSLASMYQQPYNYGTQKPMAYKDYKYIRPEAKKDDTEQKEKQSAEPNGNRQEQQQE